LQTTIVYCPYQSRNGAASAEGRETDGPNMPGIDRERVTGVQMARGISGKSDRDFRGQGSCQDQIQNPQNNRNKKSSEEMF
jgi:hypothetical protein